jgi:hypothetical protein
VSHYRPVRKYAIVAIAIAAMNFVGFLTLATYVREQFIWPTIVIPGAIGIYLLLLRCPNCKTPIFKKKLRLFDEEFTFWGGITSKAVFSLRPSILKHTDSLSRLRIRMHDETCRSPTSTVSSVSLTIRRSVGSYVLQSTMTAASTPKR